MSLNRPAVIPVRIASANRLIVSSALGPSRCAPRICPVPASKSIIANQLKDPTVANSPTVFPDAQMVSRSKPYYQFKNSQDLDQWNSTFQPIYTG